MSNLLGVHALCFAGGIGPDDVTKVIAGAKQAGFGLVEFGLQDGHEFDADRAKEELAAAGLTVTCSRGLTLDADVSSTDLAVVKRGTQLLHDSIASTASIGGIRLTGALYSAFGKAPAPLSAAGRANIVAALKEAAADAAERNVTLGLEVCNRYETNVINTAADGLRLVEDVGADNVDLHLDTYHMNIEEDNFVAPIVASREKLGYVHVGENHRGYMGSGHIDFKSFFGALKSIDYQGAITFESFSTAVVAPNLSIQLAIWRDLWDDSDDLTKSAHQFMVEQLAGA